MEKTEMMKRYEAETGKQALTYTKVYVSIYEYDYGELVPSEEYNNWLEAKAEAYDRLMSGGKKTLKELQKKKYRPFVKPKIEWLDDDFFIYTQKDKIKSKITGIERWNNTYLIKVVKVPQINYQDYIICSLKRLFKDYVFEDNSLLGEVRNNKTIETMENYIEDIANMNGEELDEFLNKGAENAQHVLDKLNMQQELNS